MMGLVRKHGRSGRKRGASRRERGYTLIEVMMAIGVLTAGAVGIMSLQSASTRGNMEARQMSTGAVLAQRWVERLRRDGLNWTQSNNTVSALLLARTTWLRTTPDPGAPVGWMVPADVPATGETANFDFYGNDTADGAEMRYCTNIRLEWLYPGRRAGVVDAGVVRRRQRSHARAARAVRRRRRSEHAHRRLPDARGVRVDRHPLHAHAVQLKP